MRSIRLPPAVAVVLGAVVLIGAPLAGAALAGRPLGVLLELPPRPELPVVQPGPSAAVLVVLAGPTLLIAGWIATRIAAAAPAAAVRDRTAAPFPGWGFAGLALLAIAWVLAWTRLPWFAPLQRHTFTPLWAGYVITIHALARWRTGSCPLTARPAAFARLVVASAAFWWLFEYLNQFTGNWYYVNVHAFGSLAYLLFATLAFASVLPAVQGTIVVIGSLPRVDGAFTGLPRLRFGTARAWGLASLGMGTASLIGVGIWPAQTFPMLWIAPGLVIGGLLALAGRPTGLEPLARGDWRPLLVPACAGLACGLLWEMWNAGSFAGWRYRVPYVDALHVFEMPLLGYAGYLPFGVECALVIRLLDPTMTTSANRRLGPADDAASA